MTYTLWLPRDYNGIFTFLWMICFVIFLKDKFRELLSNLFLINVIPRIGITFGTYCININVKLN